MYNSAPHKVKHLSIRNFKSIKDVTLTDCRRINLLIGRPNVGKSNILESLALFDIPYLVTAGRGGVGKSLKSIVRIQNVSELFHNGVSAEPIEIVSDLCRLTLCRSHNGVSVAIEADGQESTYSFSPTLNLSTKKEPTYYPDILTYFFPKQFAEESPAADFLLPPSGTNLAYTVSHLPKLRADLDILFHLYGLKMIFDVSSQQIKAMKENGHDMFLVPFTSLADSLQRLIFYKAAIGSNHGKVLCFEEPEAHTFPPYISSVVNEIVASTDNQFFITTHSPYVVSSLLEEAGNDLAIFIVDMEESSTIVRRMPENEMQRAYDNGIDMFFNIESLTGK